VFNMVMRRIPYSEFPKIEVSAGEQTPSAALNLQPGEWVRVRPRAEIWPTLNKKQRNRGLWFDVEMMPFCGGTFQVLRKVERLVDESTGRMVAPRNPCIILDGVTCGGNFSRDRRFCSRATYPYWHEVWLDRVARKEPSRG